MENYDEFKIDGVINVGDYSITVEEFQDIFLEWVTSQGYSFGGVVDKADGE
jgi:hypothetical protein